MNEQLHHLDTDPRESVVRTHDGRRWLGFVLWTWRVLESGHADDSNPVDDETAELVDLGGFTSRT